MGMYKKIRHTSAEVKCPFYLDSTDMKTSITCEGFADGMSARLTFKAIATKERHMGIYCIGRFEDCPMYKCVYDAKYKEG